jgi:hypothetical protein
VPVLFNVIVCVLFWPVVTLPKLTLDGDALIPACVPVPVRFSTVGDPPALLAIETLPVTAPAAVGVYFTLNVAVCPTFNVDGDVTPVAVKPLPVTVTPEIATAACPEFVNVEVNVELLPTATLPKLSVPGFSVNCPTAAADPVPESAIVDGDVGSLLVIEMLPVSLPAAVGANVALNVADWPAVIVFGVVIPDTPNDVPLTVITEIVRSAPPLFVKVIGEVPVVEVVTFPKFTLAGEMLSCGCAASAVPVRGTDAVDVAPSELLKFSESEPEAFPLDVPVNHTVIVEVCPAAIVNGSVTPENENCVIEGVT